MIANDETEKFLEYGLYSYPCPAPSATLKLIVDLNNSHEGNEINKFYLSG